MVLWASDLLQDGVLLLLACLVFLLAVTKGLPLPDEPDCGTGYYLNTTCIPCSVCAPGYGVHSICHGSNNTVCEPCSDEHFSQEISDNRYCTECTVCSILNKELISECTREQDSKCGKCSVGYFLQVDSKEGARCSKCSLCPPGKEAVRWYECAGDMPDNQQCAPGYDAVGTVKPPVTPWSHNLHWEVVVSQIASNQTVFISIATPESPAEQQPVFEIVVSVVSIVFTFITVVVFSCAVFSMCRRIYKRHMHT